MCSGQNGNSRVISEAADRKRARLAANASTPQASTRGKRGLMRTGSAYGPMARKTETP